MSGTPPDRTRSSLGLDVRDSDSDLVPEDLDGEDLDEEEFSDSISATFGSLTRSGPWVVADHITAAAYFGEVTLDFREANLPESGIVNVDGTAVFGSIKLIVPEGTEVELESLWALFGEIGHKTGWIRFRSFLRRWVTGDVGGSQLDTAQELLLLRVTGRATFGNVTVSTQ